MTTMLVAILGTAAGLAAVLWWAIRAGRDIEAGKAAKEKADAHEAEIDRIGRANAARRDAERDARGGMLDDEWTRDD